MNQLTDDTASRANAVDMRHWRKSENCTPENSMCGFRKSRIFPFDRYVFTKIFLVFVTDGPYAKEDTSGATNSTNALTRL
jgi:hypothetical protein